MWLINCQSIDLEEFVKDVPPYAILSHTWGNKEVTFTDMSNRDRASKEEGYQKIKATCRVALEHDLKYAWVDTCCIDKSSSAELSEAINSMFAWYKNATVCFVWLCDFTCFSDETLAEAITSFESREALDAKGGGFYGDPPQQTVAEIDLRNRVKKGLGNCKWFSRGWTLQELIAPSRINFYDKEWNYFGSKLELAPVLSWITGVDTGVLRGRPLDEVLVGRRMSWASTRTTTRVEDIAYCLLGIFDINMPLLYGEGKKAFIRLQEEIIRSSHDLSIFAWKADVSDLRRFRGLMANSPAEFKGCQRLVKPSFEWNNGGEYGLTSRGLRTDGLVRIGRGEAGQAGSYFMSLGCVDERQKKLVLAISLRQYGPGLFARRKPWPMITVFDLNVYSAAKLAHPQYICCKDSPSLENTVMNSRINAIQIKFTDSIFDVDSVTAFPQADWDLRNSILLSFQRPYYWGLWKVKVRDSDDGISIVCVRSSGWLLYGIFASNQIPSTLTRDDLLPSHVEDILQRLPDRTTTECSGFIHTVKDVHLDLGETGIEIPATLLQVNSVESKHSKQGRSRIKLVQSFFKKSKSM
ncbi:HET-domain-containing protein [Annulohypoxylon truncatum]|uniref:HET-domain-containing protein n=1 Tax=Annulohypoxylon truncatum TaxID=327061 RepID=UPI0020073997|nr:HET-domain-containing protein [Annulohypoxylon truncatum]KAI1204191.1 HET-domain-containing protein [Annulohypoxylon truncatum]